MHSPTSPFWTEYVSAFATVVGALIALVALVIAVRSARSATGSAESAEKTAYAAAESATTSAATRAASEQQLELAREEYAHIEAERARKPIVELIVPSQIEDRQGEVAPERTIRIGFTNSGTRALEDGLLTILLGPGSDAELTDRWGIRRGEVRDDETIERWPGAKGAPGAFDYFARQIRVPAGVSMLHYVRVGRRGRFSLRVKLFSTELAGNGPWVDAFIAVNADGIASIDQQVDEDGPYAGRCGDFDARDMAVA